MQITVINLGRNQYHYPPMHKLQEHPKVLPGSSHFHKRQVFDLCVQHPDLQER